MGDYIAIIGIVVSILVALLAILMAIIGYFIASRMRSIDGSLKCLPEIQVELAGMKVQVDLQSEKQEDFCNSQEAFGKRLGDVEKHISNQERIAVLERGMATLEKEVAELRRWRHDINEKSHERGLAAAATAHGVTQ